MSDERKDTSDERKYFRDEIQMIFAPLPKNRKFGIIFRIMMKTPGANGIIHIFALMHLAVALLCRYSGIMDEIWLTLLTITMVVLIGIRLQVKVELIVASVIIINLIGYFLGVYGARLIALVSTSELLTHSLATFVTTEIIGWGTYGFMRIFRKDSGKKSAGVLKAAPPGNLRKEHFLWLFAALALVLMFRAALTFLFSTDRIPDGNVIRMAGTLMSHSAVLAVGLCFIILTVRHIRLKCRHWSPMAKTIAIASALILMAAVTAFLAGMDYPHGHGQEGLSLHRFFQLFVITLALDLIMYSAVYIIDYALATRAAMYEERSKASQARFQYAKLKQQVNPHFLFNSLNILDCMVQDGQTEQASTFIHKLAGIYRYMLRNDEKTVLLEDELKFVGMYVDLLKERFPDGFRVITEIPEEICHQKLVIPCSVQMLIENAIKHNQVGGKEPLVIRITTDGETLTVTNNLRPKLNGAESTKVGLNYLREQYRDLYGKTVETYSDSTQYRVSIPLADNGTAPAVLT